jgi:ATP-dependent exoDNAse (exonuclease V) beta subunit
LLARSAGATLREWRFDLSVATPSARRIADALAAHGSPHARAYAPLVRALRDSVVGGYLNGVVDLAFEHEGQWWLMDWKSNQLGAADDDYAPPALDAAMRAAHRCSTHLRAAAAAGTNAGTEPRLSARWREWEHDGSATGRRRRCSTR